MSRKPRIVVSNDQPNQFPNHSVSNPVCTVGELAAQVSNLIAVYDDGQSGRFDTLDDMVCENAAKSIENLCNAATSLVATSQIGAIFQLCSLTLHLGDLTEIATLGSDRDLNEWILQMEKGLAGLKIFMERQFDIDSADHGFDYFGGKVLGELKLPQLMVRRHSHHPQ